MAPRRSTAAAKTKSKPKPKPKPKPKQQAKNCRAGAVSPSDNANALPDAAADTSPPPVAHPDPKVFILPSAGSCPSAAADLTLVTLPHPSTRVPTRYLLHSHLGLHEIKKMSYPSSVPRSWLVTPASHNGGSGDKAVDSAGADWMDNGQTVPDSSLYICTAIDPLFLVMAHLGTLTYFLPMDSLLYSLKESSAHWENVLQAGSKTEAILKARIRSVCDHVDVGEDKAFRLSKTKLLNVLSGKCERMISVDGLPKSMEEEFVRKVLAKPICGEKAIPRQTAEEKQILEGEYEKAEGQKETAEGENHPCSNPIKASPTPDESQSQLRPQSSDPTFLPISISSLTIAPPQPAPSPPEITHLLRLRVASQFLSTYLSTELSTELSSHLASVHDFTSLDTYISDLAKLKQELAVTRAGDYSMQKTIEDEEEAADSKRKRKREMEEEEKKKKKKLSTGVKALAKVDTKGMAKMTSFFKKKQT